MQSAIRPGLLGVLALTAIPALAAEGLSVPPAELWQPVAAAQNCNSSKPETTPVSRFRTEEQADTVFDTKTGLTWKRCTEGQAYAEGRCQGAPALWKWSDAVAKFSVQGDGWRIPSVDELSTIVEHRCRTPSANSVLFPDTPSSAFWSATASTSKVESAWWVSFFTADIANAGKKTITFPVRLTRGKEWIDASGGVLGKAQKAEQQHVEAEKKRAERDAVNQQKKKMAAIASTAIQTSVSDCLFSWAEKTYPQHFAPAGIPSATLANYYYRYYTATSNYLATSSTDNHVWTLGPISSNQVVDAGPITRFQTLSGCF